MIVSIILDTHDKESCKDEKEVFEIARILEEIAIQIHDDGSITQQELFDVNDERIGLITIHK